MVLDGIGHHISFGNAVLWRSLGQETISKEGEGGSAMAVGLAAVIVGGIFPAGGSFGGLLAAAGDRAVAEYPLSDDSADGAAGMGKEEGRCIENGLFCSCCRPCS